VKFTFETMCSPSKRRDMDIMKLMMSDHDVSMGNEDSSSDFYVKFHGPKDSPYENGIWKVHVTLPANYPYKSPSIGFCNTIFHPNVDERYGTVCLDAINQTWSPMFELVNIFEAFLPQLLLYPNPADPLNGEAAALLMKDKNAYNKKVEEYVKKFASKPIRVSSEAETETTSSSDDGEKMVEEEEEVLSDPEDLPGEDGEVAGDLDL